MKLLSENLTQDIGNCKVCQQHLPLEPRPIVQVSSSATVLIIGQAPGIKAHDTNKPWNDASGSRLRAWLGLEPEAFYDQNTVAIVPMGFCYPGKGGAGDLPPRKECAPLWHSQIIESMPIKVTFLIGQYAQKYYLKDKLALTERVKCWQNYQPKYFVLPHPSPRNNIWFKKHPWFERDVVPIMRDRVSAITR